MAGQRLNRFNFEVLRYLRAYAAGEKGWHWRGVSGWIFAAEFPRRLRLASSYLPTLSNHYCVDRSNVGDPFQHQATYLYRIWAVGLAMLGAHEQQGGAEGCIPAHVTIQQPAD